jgi:hypothetical protein
VDLFLYSEDLCVADCPPNQEPAPDFHAHPISHLFYIETSLPEKKALAHITIFRGADCETKAYLIYETRTEHTRHNVEIFPNYLNACSPSFLSPISFAISTGLFSIEVAGPPAFSR